MPRADPLLLGAPGMDLALLAVGCLASSVVELDLRFNGIGPAGVSLLAKALATDPDGALQKLDLRANLVVRQSAVHRRTQAAQRSLLLCERSASPSPCVHHMDWGCAARSGGTREVGRWPIWAGDDLSSGVHLCLSLRMPSSSSSASTCSIFTRSSGPLSRQPGRGRCRGAGACAAPQPRAAHPQPRRQRHRRRGCLGARLG
jgi:hypothetical protein